VNDLIQQCAEFICNKIDDEFYGPYDVPRNWDRHGIKILGDRRIIDAGMQAGDVPTDNYPEPESE
jgi:hypothetical protein